MNPTKLNTGAPSGRPVITDNVLNAESRDVERAQLNRILSRLNTRVEELEESAGGSGGGGSSVMFSITNNDGTINVSSDGTNTIIGVAPNGIGSTQLADGSVSSSKIVDDAVTTDKLDDDSVTTDKILDEAVTFDKIQDVSSDILLGRDSAGSGVVEEIGLDATLAFDGSGSIGIDLNNPNTWVGDQTFGDVNVTGDLSLDNPLEPTSGGTGLDSYTTGDILYASTTDTLSVLPIGSEGKVLTVASGVPSWVAGGTGTVNPGLANRLAYYPADGSAVDDLAAITASRALVSDTNGLPVASSVTSTELGYVSGVTSDIQTQLGGKQPLDATLTALAGANWVANGLPIGSGADTVSQVTFAANTFPARASTGTLSAKTITDFALTLLDDTNAAGVRGTLGLGTFATENYATPPVIGGTTPNVVNATTLSCTGNASVGGDLVAAISGNDFQIRQNTANGADSKSIFIAGGGSASVARGAIIIAYGNEYPGAGGFIDLNAGDASGARVRMQVNGSNIAVAESTGLAVTGALSCTGNATVSGNLTADNVLSGTYTPTLTVDSNVDSYTSGVFQYMRVGNVVSVSGVINVVPSLSGIMIFRVSLPISSNLTSLSNLGGSVSASSSGDILVGRIYGDTTNDQATVTFESTGGVGVDIVFMFQYIIQ